MEAGVDEVVGHGCGQAGTNDREVIITINTTIAGVVV